jgi:hypothetical protein
MVLKRFRAGGVVVAALTAAVLGLSTTPAAAVGDYSGLAYVHMERVWSDEGRLSVNDHANSNATCLWQKILWADGYLGNAAITGVFDEATREATIAWQEEWAPGQAANGIAGSGTFAAADTWLNYYGTPGSYAYEGSAHRAWLTVDDSGRFGFYDDGVHRAAGYDYRSCR